MSSVLEGSAKRQPEILSEQFGGFDFGLSAEQEERARCLHAGSVIVDMLFQGPCGNRAFTAEMVEELRREYRRHQNPQKAVLDSWNLPIRRALAGEFPDFKRLWDECGVTGGNRQTVGMTLSENVDPYTEAMDWFAFNQAQFDRFPWLMKALVAEDFRRAKREGKHAGFVSTQNTVDIGLNLRRLDQYYDFGMRMIQLTNNTVNFVGGGCTDRVDCGVTEFGTKFIRRMNELGMIVDTGHCGRQTTLDACKLSQKPVVASHTGAAALFPHDRNKTDEALKAIAATGGVIGVYCVPMFLTADPDADINDFLDHVAYVADLVGAEHVGIGTDWPLQSPNWTMERLAEWMEAIGFRAEHGRFSTQNLVGFDDYRDFPNITRGLVARGYGDDKIKGILGENFLRVFKEVCG